MDRVCTNGKCAAPVCGDDQLNGSETDTDCGGPDCDPCPDGSKCSSDSDCSSGHPCDQGSGTCVECTSDDHCLDDKVCDLSAHTCSQ